MFYTRLFLLVSLLLLLTSVAGTSQAQSDQRCFAETPHCIAGRMREFWEQNGGLPVFGLPITPQQEETIEGKPLQVQWFERNRLELHPENAPPYDVLLGRVGVDTLSKQGRNWQEFPKSDAQDGCRFFAETGHNICGDVLTSWRANGLELDGQPGATETESLALFGLPLSEMQTETLSDGKEYHVQWFERARFESHPENAVPYTMLLGLLGREVHGAVSSIALPPVELDRHLVDANTRFAFNIFDQLRKQDVGKNMFISPTSLAFALSMTYNGAQGATQAAMARALELGDMSLEELNNANAGLKLLLEHPDPKVQLTIANALWAKQGIEFEPDFLQRNRDFYGADTTVLDFADPASADTINAWVSERTNKRITKIIQELDPQSILLLVNAIYFKGTWTKQFDPKETRPHDFKLLNGTTKQVPMMSQTGVYRYFRGDHYQIVGLPYGEKRISMYLMLPDEDTTLENLYDRMSALEWQSRMQDVADMEGSILLPRFKMEYEQELKKSLTALGMGIGFECERANFTAMYKEGACISRVKQKAFVEVNEEGTEAAAATVVDMRPTSAGLTFTMTFDRPFFFLIQDDLTGTLLFMGSVVDPSANS